MMQKLPSIATDASTRAAVFRSILPFLLCLLLTRSLVMGVLSPFAAALCTVCFFMKKGGMQAALGCMVGAFAFYQEPHMLSLCAPAVLWAYDAAADQLGWPRTKTVWRMLFGGTALLCGLFFGQSPYGVAAGLAEGILALLFAEVFVHVIAAVQKLKRHAIPDEVEGMCLVLSACALLLGTGQLVVAGVPVMRLLAIASTMATACAMGPTGGGAAGLICGFCMSVADNAYMPAIGSLGVCGLLAGGCSRLKKWGTVLGFIACNAIFTFYINGSETVILPLQEQLIAGGILLAAPSGIIQGAAAALRRAEMPGGLQSETVCRVAKTRLQNMQAALYAMDRALEEETAPQEKDGTARVLVRYACKGCSDRKRCWQEHALENTMLADQMLAEYAQRGGIERVPSNCVQPREFKQKARTAFEELLREHERTTLWRRMRQNSRQRIRALTGAVERTLHSLEEPPHRAIERDLSSRLRVLGCGARSIAVCRDQAETLLVRIQIQAFDPELTGVLEHAVSCACARRMRLEREDVRRRRQGQVLTFFEAGGVSVAVGSAGSANPETKRTGDYVTGMELPGERQLICLCDGMGSGEEAARISRQAAELIVEFYRTGVEEGCILPAVNSILSMRDRDMFTTADVLVVDTVKQTASFQKTCAAPSFLIRKGVAERIQGSALPIGIVEEVQPSVMERTVAPGDRIVMLSDGISDSAPEEMLIDWLAEIQNISDPDRAAVRLVELAGRRAGRERDDMTAVVIQIEQADYERLCV